MKAAHRVARSLALFGSLATGSLVPGAARSAGPAAVEPTESTTPAAPRPTNDPNPVGDDDAPTPETDPLPQPPPETDPPPERTSEAADPETKEKVESPRPPKLESLPEVEEDKTIPKAAAGRGQLPENFIDTRNGVAERTESEGTLPTAGYDRTPFNGAFIQSPNGALRLQIGAFGVVRWTANMRDAPDPDPGEPRSESDVTQGFTLRQVQIFFESALGPLTVHVRPRVSDDTGFQVQVFWAEVKAGKRWRFRFGKHFIPLSREDWASPQDLLTTEYSPHNFAYAFGTSYGAFARYNDDRHRVWLALHTDAPDGTNDDFPSVNNDLSGVVRWEVVPVGEFAGFGDMVGRRGGPLSVMLGSSAGVLGELGNAEEGSKAAAQGNIDLSLDASGVHAMVAGSLTWVDPFGGVPFYVWGGVAQLGSFVHDHVQLYTQYSLLSPGKTQDDFAWWHSSNIGINYFIFKWTNRHRIGLEGGALFARVNETFLGPSSNLGFLASDDPIQGYVRLQLTTGF